MQKYTSIRNVAVIAHVDHGKTTLVDAMLKQSNLFRENQEEMEQERILDRNELERERGITILAKNCAVIFREVKINIIDTPGHADFSGEIERTLSMADGALLIVDAAEGPMPQTRWVLKQALRLDLKVIVIINKVDKKLAQVEETKRAIESLFLELATKEEQLEYEVLYAVGRRGAVAKDLTLLETSVDVTPLLETIVEKIRPAEDAKETSESRMLVSSLDYDLHLGKLVIGRVGEGQLRQGQEVFVLPCGSGYRLEKLFVYEGLKRQEVSTVDAGEIVALAGISKVKIGETIASGKKVTPYPIQEIGEPTLHLTLGANTSPFAGREGKYVTSRQIEERLERELESNLSLKIEILGSGKFRVSGRGELHLSVLLETMRREGYELEVGKPEVVIKTEEGRRMEPFERLEIVVPSEWEGTIYQECGRRYARFVQSNPVPGGETRLVFEIATSAALGLRTELLTKTKGTILYASEVIGFGEAAKQVPRLRSGVIVSSHTGEALAYGLSAAQERGISFIMPGTEVYEGMIVGQTGREEDIRMNVTKGKQLTNMRSKSSDGIIQLAPPKLMSLEQCLDFVEEDELLEITPESLRLRKKNLTGVVSKRMGIG